MLAQNLGGNSRPCSGRMLRAGGRGRVLVFLITAACAIDHALSFKAVIVFQRLSSDRWSMCRRCPRPLRSEPTTAGGAGEWEKEARRLQQDLDCAQLRIATLEGQLTEQKALHEADLAELRCAHVFLLNTLALSQ